MNLIDRYLAAVRRHLPAGQQDDIVQELGDSLRSEVEEREQEAGRPLDDEEQAALLKKRGHPWLMASRYWPQQHLIGPALYPYYRQALVMVVFWVVLPIALFGGAINAIYSEHASQIWGRMLGAAWNGAIYSVGMVTIVFAVLEHERVRFTALDNWNPRRLPDFTRGYQVSRVETLVGLVFALTFLVWWTDLVRVPEFMINDGEAVRFVPGPIWTRLYYPILASLLASIGLYLIDLVQPWRTPAVSAAHVTLSLINVAIVVLVFGGGPYIDVVVTPQFADRAAMLSSWLNTAVRWTFVSIGIVSIWDVLYEVWRYARTRTALALAC